MGDSHATGNKPFFTGGSFDMVEISEVGFGSQLQGSFVSNNLTFDDFDDLLVESWKVATFGSNEPSLTSMSLNALVVF